MRACLHVGLSVLIAGFGVSCGPELVYESRTELPSQWTYADSVSFDYEIVDTSRAYDLALSFDHSTAFATENLYAQFITRYPDGSRQAEALSLVLADRFGSWLGDCAGESCTLLIPLQDSARFPTPGRYGLTVKQYMRRDSLLGPQALGLRVSVAE